MPNYSVSTEITGRGNLAEVAKRATDALRGMVAPIKAVNQAIDKPETTALGRVGQMVDSVAGRFRAGLSSITSWLPALGAIASVATMAGFIAMTRDVAEAVNGIGDASTRLGVTRSELSALRTGFKQTGIAAENGEKAIGSLNKTIFAAATGKNKDAAALFARLGISLRDANGHVSRGADVLPQLSQAFERNENATLRSAMAQALFGKSGEDLIPFLVKGRTWLQKLREENAKYKSLTEEQLDGLDRLAPAYERLDLAGSGLASRLAASLAPGLTKVVDATSGWIARNRELIGQSLDRKVASITRAVQFVSGAFTAFLAIPWVGRLLEGVDAGTAVDVSLGALGLTMAGPLLAALQVVTGAWWAMTRAMLANPIVLAVAAVAAGAYAIYANWGSITSWFNEQMDAVRAAFDRGFGQGLLEIWVRFNPFTVIQTAINGLVKWLFGIDLFEEGARLLKRLIDGIKSMLPDFDTVWAPIGRAINWYNGRMAARSEAMNQGVQAGNMPGDFNPSMFAPPVSVAAPAPTSLPLPQRSESQITVKFENTPPGTIVDSSTRGPAQVETNVGYSMMPNAF